MKMADSPCTSVTTNRTNSLQKSLVLLRFLVTECHGVAIEGVLNRFCKPKVAGSIPATGTISSENTCIFTKKSWESRMFQASFHEALKKP